MEVVTAERMEALEGLLERITPRRNESGVGRLRSFNDMRTLGLEFESDVAGNNVESEVGSLILGVVLSEFTLDSESTSTFTVVKVYLSILETRFT